MSDHDRKDQPAPQANDATELSDDTLEEVAGGFGFNDPVIEIGPPPFVSEDNLG